MPHNYMKPLFSLRPATGVVALLLLLLAGPRAARAYVITTQAVQGGTSFCAGAAVRVPYSVDQPFNSGNVFTAELSDANGSFTAPVTLGSLSGTSNGIVQGVIPAGTVAGTGYRIRVTGSAPATVGADNGTDLTVNNLGALTASANTPLCVGDNLLLSASLVPGASYSWTGPNGFTSLLRNPSIANVSTSRSGTYTVTAAANGCSVSAQVVVAVSPLPVVSITPANNAVICSGSSVQLTASGGATYSWSPSTGLSSSTIANPIASPTTSTIYTVTATSAAGCSNTAQVTVTVRATPTVSVNPTAPSICAGSSVTLAATGAQNYQWSPTTGLSNPSAANPIASPTQTTTYTVTGTSNGCTSTSQVTVTVENPPAANAGPAQVLCSGQATTLGTAAVPGLTYSWSPSTGLSSTSAAQPTLTPTNTTNAARTTTYTLTVVSASGCVSTSSTQVTVNPAVTATPGPALSLCPNQPGQLGTTAVAGVTYSWSPTTGLSSATVANPTVTLPNATNAPITQTYTLTASRNGCQSTGTVAVTVNPTQNAGFSYGAAVLCTAGGNPTPTLSGSATGTFTAAPAGLVFVSATTGQINAAASTPGTYTVTYTTNGPCASTATNTITLTTTPSAAFQYPNATYCLGGGTAVPVLASGAIGGTYTSTPGLSLNASTGVIDLTASTAGTYTITNTVGSGGTCSAVATTTVTLTAGANVAVSAGQPTLCAGQSTTLTATGGITYTYTGGGQTLTGATVTVSPTQTTTYTVTGTTAGGCTSTATVTVTVNPVPVLTAGASVAAVCPGQSATLSASGASTFTWTGGGQTLTGPLVTVTPTQTTTYTVTGANASGCTATSTVTVTVNALPTVSLTLPTNSLCSSSATLTLSGGSPAGGTYSGVGVSNGVFSAASTGPGTYTISYTAANAQGCTATATQQLTVTTCLATKSTAPAAELAVFPNPSTGLVTLTLTGAQRATAGTGAVLNTLGQAVARVELPAAGSGPLTQTLDLHELPSGVYLLRLNLGQDQWLTRRLVLRH
ncbi:T9SS type A sorting domain-containing protein [Hymenobacter properus]|uniref:T9SS type A sorting domain-containing protein n=1 Tax=Hymenobacter properus TaxID=2791026 RepID=A0A931FJ17_9BACT|nr:T9SS type A sorting domain-containing protein [Hymenobacter properus]MBF9142557.1 T9SS type A sorting domain-containing protein [Hymenobacter properus]MBR7721364.1 T9SS type A sorting domain-containing protein [Microvirga sp. SRT04]